MSFFKRNYKAFAFSGLLIAGLSVLLMVSEMNFFIVNPEHVHWTLYIVTNSIFALLCWWILAALLVKFAAYKVIGVLSFLVLTIVFEHYMPTSNNPFSIPFIILFWLGATYLIVPQFFKKYRFLILGVYGLVIAYFIILYSTTPNFDSTDRESFANFMLLPLPFFIFLWGYEQWRWFQTLRANTIESELTLLKSQINPHFFFNTLNNLYGLALEKSEKAPEVILKLSDMMRYTIYEGQKEKVSLKAEIAYLNNYIELHEMRYKKEVSIDFTYNVEETLQITPLLFIILLENAFKHGVEKMRSDSYVKLHMTTIKNQLTFQIENNFDVTLGAETVGIGLENLRKRLAYSYPNAHTLTIEKEAAVYSATLTLELT
jgi:hypothetical protein